MAKTPQEMSNEELLKTEKSIKILMTVTIVGSIAMVATGIYLSVVKTQSIISFLFLFVVFASLGFSNYYNLRGLRKEKAIRDFS